MDNILPFRTARAEDAARPEERPVAHDAHRRLTECIEALHGHIHVIRNELIRKHGEMVALKADMDHALVMLQACNKALRPPTMSS